MARPKRILLLYGSEPDPLFLERARALHLTEGCEVHFAYWRRGATAIRIPFREVIPAERFIPIDLPNPQGNMARRLALYLRFAFKLRRVIGSVDPDGVYAVSLAMCGVARLAMLGKRKPRRMYELMDQYGTRLSWWRRWLYRRAVGGVATTIIQSPAVVEHLQANRLDDTIRPHLVVPPGPSDWEYEHRPRSDGGPVVIGCFGYLRSASILNTLIEAAKLVAEEGYPIALRFAGAGPHANLIRAAAAEANAAWLSHSGPFEYFGEYRSLFQQADVVFAAYTQRLPNNTTHIARRFCEAVASGVPVIVAAGSYMARLVERERCGWSVNPTSATAMAALLRQICDNPAERDMSKVNPEFKAWNRFETHAERWRAALLRALA